MDRAQLRGRDNVITFFPVRWEYYVAMDRIDSPGVRTTRSRRRCGRVFSRRMRCSALGARPKRCPDLAIEIVPTNESIDKLEIYKRLRVREVWFWQTREVRAYMRWLERH